MERSRSSGEFRDLGREYWTNTGSYSQRGEDRNHILSDRRGEQGRKLIGQIVRWTVTETK